MEKPIVLYTDHYTNRAICHSFAQGSDSLMCHVDNFTEFNKTIATYGYLRGTGEVIKKSKNCKNFTKFLPFIRIRTDRMVYVNCMYIFFTVYFSCFLNNLFICIKLSFK